MPCAAFVGYADKIEKLAGKDLEFLNLPDLKNNSYINLAEIEIRLKKQTGILKTVDLLPLRA